MRGQGSEKKGPGVRQSASHLALSVLPTLTPRQTSLLGRRLLRWFAEHQRSLPWRRDRDPYRIWVSEVLLQQTQVATVITAFDRFLNTFPTLADLAAATEQDVLKGWEGLGYYRRARDLHRAARILVNDHGGSLPDDPAVWAELPGVGRYMLGAVLSQAFDRRLPIVEANSQRVFCRLFGQRGDPRKSETKRWLWQAAESLLPRKNVGDFNQALMELGALVCTPAAPRCDACPLAEFCAARSMEAQSEIPVPAKPPEMVEVREAAVVLRRDQEVLLVQRPASGRWAGMWEFPHAPLKDNETHDEAAARIVRSLTGLRARIGKELHTVRHGVTRFRITMVCFEARYQSGEFHSDFYVQQRWLALKQLQEFPISSPQRRLANELIREGRQPQLF